MKDTIHRGKIVSGGLVYCFYQGRHNAITSNLTYKAHVK